jgi:lauroyl/myristoyl acyltransferase
MIKRWGSQAIVFLMWLLHWLPLPLLAAIGEGVGALLWRLAGSRRKVVLKNLALCFPELDEAAAAPAREHFGAVARGFLEHSYLWFASEERLLRMVRIEGDIHLAERTGRPVMWLLPHFVGLDYTAPALMLKQSKPAITIYQRQSNAVFDEALLKARAVSARPGCSTARPASGRCCGPSRKAPASSTCRTWTSAPRTRPSCPSSVCRPPPCWRRRAWPSPCTCWCSPSS